MKKPLIRRECPGHLIISSSALTDRLRALAADGRLTTFFFLLATLLNAAKSRAILHPIIACYFWSALGRSFVEGSRSRPPHQRFLVLTSGEFPNEQELDPIPRLTEMTVAFALSSQGHLEITGSALVIY